MCNILECLFKPSYGFKFEISAEKLKKYHQICFVFSLVWSLGAVFYEKHHDAFDILIRKVYNNINVPHSDSVYGFFIDPLEIQF